MTGVLNGIADEILCHGVWGKKDLMSLAQIMQKDRDSDMESKRPPPN